jgi:MSHA pilin protein MshD
MTRSAASIPRMPAMLPGLRARGLSLIELLLFIVVVGIALSAMLQLFATATRNSADPMILRQQLAIAESMLREVTLMPFTWCDPDLSTNTGTASSAADCSVAEGPSPGPEGGQTRTASPYFNNVSDYAGFTMTGISDVAGQAVPGLAGYGVSVAVAEQALDSVPAGGAALKVTVTVTAPGASPLSLQGWRTRYAPNAVD